MVEFDLKVLSPDGEVFNGKALSLSVRGAQGDLMVMGGHIPFITTVKPGKCVLELPDDTVLEGYLDSGILDVGKTDVKLLVGNKNLFN